MARPAGEPSRRTPAGAAQTGAEPPDLDDRPDQAAAVQAAPAMVHGYGHWCYASGSWEIDGKTITGDASHNVPVRLNSVMRLDPSLAGPGGWTIGLVDPVAGGQAYFETRVAVDKA